MDHKNIWMRKLATTWSAVTLITFAVMLTHQSDNPVVFNRYSPLVALLLAGLLVLALILIGIAWALSRRPAWLELADTYLQSWRQRQWFTPLLLMMAGGALVVVWLFFLGNHLATYGFLRAYLGLSIIVGALALTFGGGAAFRFVRWPYPLLAIVILLVLVGGLTLSFYPALLKTDEAGAISMARNVLDTGHVAPAIYRMVYPEDYFAGGLWTWVMAAWLKITGFSLESGRLYVLVLSIVAVAFVSFAAARLYDRTTAWFAALIGAFAFISLNHTRYDIHCALFLAAGLFFYSIADQFWWAHWATGLAVGLCIDSNPIGYCFGLGLAVVYFGRYFERIRSRRQWFWPPFWLLVAGGLLAIIIYFRMRSGAAFAEGGNTVSAFSGYLAGAAESFAARFFVDMSGQYLGSFLVHQPILFVLMVWGLITALRERTVTDRMLVILWAAWTGIIIFTYIYFPFFYIVHALPIVVLLAARAVTCGLQRLLNSGSSSALAGVTASLVGLWLLAAVAYDIIRLPASSLEDVVETARYIAEIVPEDAVIVAAEPYYFGMPEHKQFVGGAVESLMARFQRMTPEAIWSLLAPDALVFSSKWSTEPEKTPALLDYMEQFDFALIGCWETQSFGRIELWMQDLTSGTLPVDPCIRVCNPRLGCG